MYKIWLKVQWYSRLYKSIYLKLSNIKELMLNEKTICSDCQEIVQEYVWVNDKKFCKKCMGNNWVQNTNSGARAEVD